MDTKPETAEPADIIGSVLKKPPALNAVGMPDCRAALGEVTNAGEKFGLGL